MPAIIMNNNAQDTEVKVQLQISEDQCPSQGVYFKVGRINVKRRQKNLKNYIKI